MWSSKCGECGYMTKMLNIFKLNFDNELVKTILCNDIYAIRPLLPM